MASYIVVLGHRDALTWVVCEQRMAFPAHRLNEARRLRPGDKLFLYATRGAFRNPTRDRGRIFGEAETTSSVASLKRPVRLAGREFTSGCRLAIEQLMPLRQGVELAPLVPKLEVFPDERSWPVRMRRTLVPLIRHDAALLGDALSEVASPRHQVLETYRSPKH
jgi:hypothetical protein